MIAQIHQDLAVKQNKDFDYLRNFFFNDLGHKNDISGSEAYLSMTLFDYLKNQNGTDSLISNIKIQHCDRLFNGIYAVDLKLIVFDNCGKIQQTIYCEIKPGYDFLRGFNFEKNLNKILNLLQKEREITQLNDLALVLDCSESNYNKVEQMRGFLVKYNLQNEIFLIHKYDAISIKKILIENFGILTENDKIVNKNVIFEKELSVLSQKKLSCMNPSCDKHTRDAFFELQDKICLKKNNFKGGVEKVENNGYEEVLEPGLLDALFDHGF